MTHSCWQIRLLGGLQAQCSDRIVTQFPKRKMATLLAWLAFYPQKTHSREMLAEMLWPDEEPEPVQDRFRHVLVDLRRLLEPEGTPKGSVLAVEPRGVHLNSDLVQVDVARFEAANRAAARMSDAETGLSAQLESLEQYGGELLPGFYEEWILRERERLAERYRSSLCDAAERLAQRGQFAQAIELARREVEADPLQEDGHSLLMRLYARAERPSEVKRQYRLLERTLKLECDRQPSPTLRRMFEQFTLLEISPGNLLIKEDAAARMPLRLEPTGGAVPLQSNLYLVRPVDEELNAAIALRDSIVLLKGARQTGKTSLLGRGLQEARKTGAKTFTTDLQKFTGAQMESAEALFRAIAETMIDGLDIEVDLDAFWKSGYGWNVNFERFIRRHVLRNPESHLVWALDEVDRLFGFPYSTEIFGLFRAWHNERMLDPDGPWSRLTLCIAYATEAHLFIKDINQSPFNVGTRLLVDDFTVDQIAEMNLRCGTPLHTLGERTRFSVFVGGNPYLVQRGLAALANDKVSLSALEASAESRDGVFGDTLRRMVAAIRLDTALVEAVLALLAGKPCPTPESFYRLKSAGVIIGASASQASFRCQLYRTYLETHLREG